MSLLHPDELAKKPNSELLELQEDALADFRREAKIGSMGTGLEVAFELTATAWGGIAMLADKPIGYVLGAVSIGGAYLGHKLHTNSEIDQLTHDFDLSALRSELRNRGLESDIV